MLMDCEQSADGEVAALRTLLAHRVDGLLLSTVGIELDVFEDVVGRRGVPCVFFDSAVPERGRRVGAARQRRRDRPPRRPHGRARPRAARASRRLDERDERPRAARRPSGRRSCATGSTRTPPTSAASAGRATTATRRPTHARPPSAPPTAIVSSSVELALGGISACSRARPRHSGRRRARDLRRRLLRRAPRPAADRGRLRPGRGRPPGGRAPRRRDARRRTGAADRRPSPREPRDATIVRMPGVTAHRPRDPSRRRLEALRGHARAPRDRPRDRRGRVLLPARAVRLRQDDDAEPDRRLRQPVERRDLHPRRARRPPAAVPAQRQHRLPVATRSSRT